MRKLLAYLTAACGAILMAACSVDTPPSAPDPASAQGNSRTAEDGGLEGPGAEPMVCFYSIDEEGDVVVEPGGSATAQAPLSLSLMGRVSNPMGYSYVCEWVVWETKDNGTEDTPLVTRFEEDTSYLLTRSGGYGVKLYVTFTQGTDTIEYESDVMTVVISESELISPDGFSPNGDGINDEFRVTAQSLVEMEAVFYNRWGQTLHTATLANATRVEGEPDKLILWDGTHGGSVVAAGVYLLRIKARGSDGVEYDIKKTITVLKEFSEGEETGESA